MQSNVQQCNECRTGDFGPNFYEAIFEHSPIGISVYDAEGQLVDANRKCLEIFGINDLSAAKSLCLFDAPDITADHRAILKSRGSVQFTTRFDFELVKSLHPFPSARSGVIHLNVTINSVDKLLSGTAGYVALVQDVTTYTQTEESLQENEQRIRSLSDNIPGGLVYQIDAGTDGRQRRFTYLAGSIERLHELSLAEAQQNPDRLRDQIYEADLLLLAERAVAAQESMTPLRSEVRVLLPSGDTRWRLFTAAPRRLPNGHLVWDGIEIDISEIKRDRQSLRESEENFEALMNSAHGFFIYRALVDTNNSHYARIVQVSPSVTEVIGATDLYSWASSFENFHPDDLPRVLEANRRSAQEGILYDEVARYYHNIRKEYVWIRTISQPVYDEDGDLKYFNGICIDVNQQKRMEEELHKVQRLESLGSLAGGIAHDFNNLMGGIFAHVDLARHLSQDGTVRGHLETALATLERTRGLTRQLLTFAKGGAPIRRVGALFPDLKDAALFALSGSNVSCRFDIPRDVWPCSFDKSQIEQVIDNIVINAQQAMPAGGTVELIAANVTLGEKQHVKLARGAYVRISIKDQGIGMPPSLLPRIFDPYFTTKPLGHGLGLATCYSIIDRHGGAIDVESEPGRGSTFHVWLPAAAEAGPDQPPLTGDVPCGNGTIIVMDDEEVLREAIRSMLVTLGYTAIAVKSGEEALELLDRETKAGRPVAGVILDLTVTGGLGGLETVAQIRTTDADLPVFVASGYAAAPVMQDPPQHGFTASICKPFRLQELARMLSAHLRSS
jgi:PAS domain S-box-containing protein